jgi:hypothetical protein
MSSVSQAAAEGLLFSHAHNETEAVRAVTRKKRPRSRRRARTQDGGDKGHDQRTA